MTRRTGYDTVKRLLDVVAASLLLVVTLPLQLVVALIVRTRLGRPVLFSQQRPGRDGEVFTLVKFRTMRPAGPGEDVRSDAERLTPAGARLRSLSLDELPTLLNVVRGDMSLVGPRPLLVDYLDRYTLRQARRHEVRPGITGLAQVSGRNALSWDDRLQLDVEYVDRCSLWLDLAILVRTVSAVAGRRGIAERGSATMSEFTGSGAPHA
ncbi:sugar transferase [Aeromicrobium chenweiae]|uniref:UDP-galactose phosphate transferase n=1 Tax=Aeromicrobium chenweiae TaxID=2079793 RepID=A0A2S0WIN2_9ACTN|nr:sugar transferase [Aeromicrobium chenweiae]AWB91199.1 UDP-galactose phosphate transferase [Aeromicrobium chenweiae]TGN31717.1 sugar transferase [Aeromicrobium chenweiae]